MLKIKDDVDLTDLDGILLKKGFYPSEDIHGNQIMRKYGHFKVAKNRHILPLNGGGNDRFDMIFDLIKADLVEKVGE